MPCREICSEKYVLLNAEVKPVYSNFTLKTQSVQNSIPKKKDGPRMRACRTSLFNRQITTNILQNAISKQVDKDLAPVECNTKNKYT